MNIQARADQLALAAIKADARTRLRSPNAETKHRKDSCIDQLVVLLDAELTKNDVLIFAAEAVYRANFFEQRTIESLKRSARLMGDLEMAESAATGDARTSKTKLAKLNTEAHPLIAKAVNHGRAIETKQKGLAGGNGRAAKIAKVEAFAVNLYSQKKWPSARQAAKELSDQVQAEAKKQGWTMSADQAQKTISGWLGPKKMGSRQPAKVPR